ncbi:hypothetical protein ACHAXH_007658 [Discostella pseudostelligera]|jgi:monothiol glutaredoxin
MNRLVNIRSGSRLVAQFNGGAITSRATGGGVFSSTLNFPVESYAASNQSSTVANYTSSQHCHRRHFSSSHDDFSPQKKHNLNNDTNEEESILSLIDAHVKSNPIMLYMKGSPNNPQCGFSATVVAILKNSGVDFASVNVLDYPEVREGVKKYAQWPTIPQLYVSGEFVGGCDVVREMEESGELKDLLRKAIEDAKREEEKN